MMQTFSRLYGRALSEEEGQSMVFGALSMLLLGCFIAMVFNVGDGTSRKIQVQNAADAAAYSGAQIEANSLSSIAWINDGMAFIYYHIMRYAVDYVTFSTLKKFAEHSPEAAPTKVIGVPGVTSKYNQANKVAGKWIKKGQNWLKNLSEMERAIAIATPGLIKKEVIEIAIANGAKAVSLVPDPGDQHYWTPHSDYRYSGSYLDRPRFKSREHKRFAEDKQEEFIKKWGKFPKWWEKTYGMVDYMNYNFGYYQIRTCWNKMDREHQPGWPENRPHTTPPLTLAFYGAPPRATPGGHWHLPHNHYIMGPYGPIPVPDPANDGHYSDSPNPHMQDILDTIPHHAIMPCPVCRTADFDSLVNEARDGEIGKSDWAYFNFQDSNRDLQRIDINSFSLPLFLKGDEFKKNGLTVMTWSPPSDKTLVTAIFKNHPSGYFAIARAKIGLLENNKINTDMSGSFFTSVRNLYSPADEPVQFGARLVPLRETNAGDIKDLLKNFIYSNSYWYTRYPQHDANMTQKIVEQLYRLGPNRNARLDKLGELLFH